MHMCMCMWHAYMCTSTKRERVRWSVTIFMSICMHVHLHHVGARGKVRVELCAQRDHGGRGEALVVLRKGRPPAAGTCTCTCAYMCACMCMCMQCNTSCTIAWHQTIQCIAQCYA